MSEQVPERSLLGGALSLEFSDCSIAAADLSTKANTLAARAKGKRTFYVVGGRAEQQILKYADLENSKNKLRLDGYSSNLVLVQPIGPGPGTTGQKAGFLRRASRKPEPIPVPISDPYLGIIVGQDTLLPLASFARRSGGNCSYVQLGQEITDDSIYVTAADEQSPRHLLIEALRTLVSGDLRDAGIITIQQFIDQQAEINRSELVQVYERQMVGAALEKLNQQPVERRLIVLDEERPVVGQYDTFLVVPPRVLSPGRVVSLVVAAPKQVDGQTHDHAEIFAVTRQEVALPLANISGYLGSLEFAQVVETDQDNAKRQALIRDLLFAITSRPSLETYQQSSGYYSSHASNEIAVYCAQHGLLKPSKLVVVKEVSSDRYRQLDDFFAYPEPGKEPFRYDIPSSLKMALNYLRHDAYKVGIDLINQFGVDKELERRLGPARRCDELLMHHVGRLALAGQEVTALFHNVRLGNTVSDVLFAASAQAHEGTYYLRIAGRPVSMPDEPMRELIPLWIDPTQKNLGLDANNNGPFDEAGVEELVDYLAQIRSARQL